jgi:two-component system response regulator
MTAVQQKNLPAKSVFTIFMADDDFDDQNFLKMAVHKYSPEIKVECVSNGMDLLGLLKTKKEPDLIILDLNMPQRNGKDILKDIKTNDVLKHIPVIIYTTSTSPDEINTIYDLGANSFLTKPRDFKEISSAMSMICSYWMEVMSLPKK